METKGNKIIYNVKTIWILMFNPSKWIMVEYKILLINLALDNLTNQQSSWIMDTFVTFRFCMNFHAFYLY
jgi:hypothetical protein